MTSYQTYKASGSDPEAIFKTCRTFDFKPNKKRKPAYYNDFLSYENANLIFLTTDWNIVNFVRRLSGLCLLCEGLPNRYDLSFCYEKDVWVILIPFSRHAEEEQKV